MSEFSGNLVAPEIDQVCIMEGCNDGGDLDDVVNGKEKVEEEGWFPVSWWASLVMEKRIIVCNGWS